jgi:hypothetical protein
MPSCPAGVPKRATGGPAALGSASALGFAVGSVCWKPHGAGFSLSESRIDVGEGFLDRGVEVVAVEGLEQPVVVDEVT